MTLILAAALLSLAVVIYVLSPILQDRRAPLESSGDDLTDAQARKRVALMALRDAEYDFATGKLGDEDYQQLRHELSVEALQALQNQEALEQADEVRSAAVPAAEGGSTAGPPDDAAGDTKAPRTGAAPGSAPDHDEGAAGRQPTLPEDRARVTGSREVEAEVARVREGLQSGDTCGHCGHVNRAGGSFCTSCGRPLSRPAATSG